MISVSLGFELELAEVKEVSVCLTLFTTELEPRKHKERGLNNLLATSILYIVHIYFNMPMRTCFVTL